MTTKHELLEQLMQMKRTLEVLKSLCKEHPDNSLIDEVRKLRIDIMNNGANYFIDMIEEMEGH